jgi:hypothetical protein
VNGCCTALALFTYALTYAKKKAANRCCWAAGGRWGLRGESHSHGLGCKRKATQPSPAQGRSYTADHNFAYTAERRKIQPGQKEREASGMLSRRRCGCPACEGGPGEGACSPLRRDREKGKRSKWLAAGPKDGTSPREAAAPSAVHQRCHWETGKLICAHIIAYF